MRRAISVAPAGRWPSERAGATVTLPFTERHRRRLKLTDDAGAEFLLDLPETAVLADGDGLALEKGGWIAVRAAPEDVADIRCDDVEALARVAWHLGNRHLPIQVIAGGLRLRQDAVIEDMLRQLGATVTRTRAPFAPEGGAYARGGTGHGLDHDHG